MKELLFSSAHLIRDLIKKKEICAKEIVQASLQRVSSLERSLRAFITVDEGGALRKAEEVDKAIKEGKDPGPLAGIPIALKDNLCTRNLRTTCGSRMLENFIPPYSATVVERLENAGAVILGKTNLDEFAMGSSTENSAFFSTSNPWDLSRVPGGSSGGSAAAVSAGEVFLALGSDTGGSVRQPASFCGVVGLKPTYGRVSRYGLVAFASSLDQIGTLARNVTDCALISEIISGHDPLDSTSLPDPVPAYQLALKKGKSKWRVGLMKNVEELGMQPEVKTAYRRSIKLWEEMGCSICEVELPHTEHALPTYYLIAPSEASANLARYDGIRFGLRVEGETLISTLKQTRAKGFGAEVKRRIMLGTYALSAGYRDAFYLKALKVRTLILYDFLQAFEHVDFLWIPTSPTLPFRLGERTRDPLSMYMADLFTIPISLAGLPALSLPVSLEAGLPVGMQLVGKTLGEPLLFQAAKVYEEASGVHDLRPPLEGKNA